MREVCPCAVTERMCACRQRKAICRHRSGNAQTTEVGALFKRAVTVLSALCQCPLMATETLRGCVQTAGGYMETTFGECTDNEKKETVISDYSEMRTEGTSRPSVGMLSRLLRTPLTHTHAHTRVARGRYHHVYKASHVELLISYTSYFKVRCCTPTDRAKSVCTLL